MQVSYSQVDSSPSRPKHSAFALTPKDDCKLRVRHYTGLIGEAEELWGEGGRQVFRTNFASLHRVSGAAPAVHYYDLELKRKLFTKKKEVANV